VGVPWGGGRGVESTITCWDDNWEIVMPNDDTDDALYIFMLHWGRVHCNMLHAKTMVYLQPQTLHAWSGPRPATMFALSTPFKKVELAIYGVWVF